MSKQITLTTVKVQEVRYRPNDSEPSVTLFYDVCDAQGNVVGQNSMQVLLADLPAKTATVVTDYLTKLSTIVANKELV